MQLKYQHNHKLNISIFFILFIALLVSCENNNEESAVNGDKKDEQTVITKNEISENQINKIVENLQGEWKEPEYPFRRAEFKNQTVKFTEEGVLEEPRFKKFQIAAECPFNTNNIRNLKPDDILLVIPEDERCEKLHLSNDTLLLSGYSVTTKYDYQIIYKKVN